MMTKQYMERLYEYVQRALRSNEPPPKVTVGDVPSGRGLVLTEDVKPGECVLRVPPAILASPKTLATGRAAKLAPRTRVPRPRTGSVALSTHQLLALILAAWHEAGGTRLDAFFSTLPQEFDTVPLIWAEQPNETHTTLLAALPISARACAKLVRQNFQRDWEAVQQVLQDAAPDFQELWASIGGAGPLKVTHSSFLWGWLCVNSRCVYQDLGYSSHADNFVMAPMLDMANHTHDASQVFRVRFDARDGLELIAPAGGRKKDDEVCITYGPHGSARLLAEYGFVTLPSGSGEWDRDPYTGVLVDEAIEARIAAHREGARLRRTLEEYGYWGDYTLHPVPAPAHPSHRLHMALRLLCGADACGSESPAASEAERAKRRRASTSLDELERVWKLVTSGVRERISAENDRRVRDSVRTIANDACEDLVKRLNAVGAHGASSTFVRTLLEDEIATCKLVAASSELEDAW